MVIDWLAGHWVEIFGALAGFIYIFFSIKQSIWLWPVGFITSAAYVIVFFQSKLYADMLLQVYYLLVSVYGWYYWIKGKVNNKKEELPITQVSLNQWFVVLLSTILLSTVLYFVLKNYTDSNTPFWDGFVSAGSVVATWMLARKFLEQWIIWIIVDFFSIFLFIYKELYATAGLFVVYTVLAIIGYIEWRKQLT